MAVITISRQFGSGGDEIAARLCKMLGYRYFDKELMAQVASEMDISEEAIEDFSEDNYKVQSFMDRLFGWRRDTMAVAQIRTWKEDEITGARLREVKTLDETHSINLVRQAIESAYGHGNVVILGRGGQAILKDKPDVLHVRISVSLNERVKRLQKRENMSFGGAQDAAIKHDRASADYLRRFHNIDWADPTLYHLVVNTDKLSIDAAAELIIKALDYLPKAETATS
jgi:cytidylate kinase